MRSRLRRRTPQNRLRVEVQEEADVSCLDCLCVASGGGVLVAEGESTPLWKAWQALVREG